MTTAPEGGRPATGRPVPDTAVPRSAFLPNLIWPYDMDTGESVAVRRSEDPELWERYAAADVPIVTQWDDGRHTGDGPGAVPTSSASMPSVVAAMLDDLDIEDGQRVLEIGTGTGWNAALLAGILGPGRVVSVEVDPGVADRARKTMESLGLGVEVLVGDGSYGYRTGGPWDRIIATCGLRHIPYGWVEQARTGAVIVAPWGTHFSNQDAIARLTVADDGTCASGHFTRPAEFMKLRAQRTPPAMHELYVNDGVAAAEHQSTTRVRETDLLGDGSDRFHPAAWALGLRIPECRWSPAEQRDGARPVWLYSTRCWSWACAMFQNGASEARVWQSGRRRLWDELETALAWWTERDCPGAERFGLTIDEQGQRAWLDDPSVSWPV